MMARPSGSVRPHLRADVYRFPCCRGSSPRFRRLRRLSDLLDHAADIKALHHKAAGSASTSLATSHGNVHSHRPRCWKPSPCPWLNGAPLRFASGTGRETVVRAWKTFLLDGVKTQNNAYLISFLPANSMALSMASAICSNVSFVSGGRVMLSSLRSDSRTG